jgi:hypothetical protein
MTVGQVSNGADANRVRPREITEKKKVDHNQQKQKKEDTSNVKSDRVEISNVAKSLLHKIVVENDFDKNKYPELKTLEEKFLKRMWEELGEDFEVREHRVAEVAVKLREAFYDRPDVLMSTAKQIVNEILGQ